MRKIHNNTPYMEKPGGWVAVASHPSSGGIAEDCLLQSVGQALMFGTL